MNHQTMAHGCCTTSNAIIAKCPRFIPNSYICARYKPVNIIPSTCRHLIMTSHRVDQSIAYSRSNRTPIFFLSSFFRMCPVFSLHSLIFHYTLTSVHIGVSLVFYRQRRLSLQKVQFNIIQTNICDGPPSRGRQIYSLSTVMLSHRLNFKCNIFIYFFYVFLVSQCCMWYT